MILFIKVELFFKMPYKISQAARFFQKIGHNILRDYYEVCLVSSKGKFASRTIDEFNRKAEDLDLEDVLLFIDGSQNFMSSMNLFTLCAIHEDDILIFDVFTSYFYWGNYEEFFVHGIKTKQNYEFSNRIITCDIIPTSLKIKWLLIGAIDGFVNNDPRFTLLLSSFQKHGDIFCRSNNVFNVLHT